MAIETFCDRGIVYSLCALIFVLPFSIALLSTFAVLAILFYFLKKTNRIALDWPSGASRLNSLAKFHFIRKGLAPSENFLNVPLLFLTLAIFISVILSQYPGLSLYAFLCKFLKGVFLYFCFIEAFRDQRRICLFLKFFLGTSFVVALSGVTQHFIGVDFIKGNFIGTTENIVLAKRISSSFSGPNAFGAYLLPVIGLVANFLYTAIARYTSRPTSSAAGPSGEADLVLAGFMAFLLVLLLACLCWTYSRSSWIGYLAVLFVMGLIDLRKWWFSVVLFLVFIFVFLPSLSDARNLALVNDNSGKAKIKSENLVYNVEPDFGDVGSGRYGFWKKAISIIRSSPVWGTGLNTYTRIIKRDPNRETWWYAHNCYLQLAAETGLAGLACFLWMLFILFRQGLNYCKKIKESWPLSFLQGGVAGLFGFMFQSTFDNTFYTVQLGALMWLLFGFIVAVIRFDPQLQEIK